MKEEERQTNPVAYANTSVLSARRVRVDAATFAELTGLRPSRAWRRAGLYPPSPYVYDHARLWRDRDGRFYVSTEPYHHELPKQLRDRHGIWLRVHNYVMHPGPDPTLFLLSAPEHGGSIVDLAARMARSPGIAFGVETS